MVDNGVCLVRVGARGDDDLMVRLLPGKRQSSCKTYAGSAPSDKDRSCVGGHLDVLLVLVTA